MKVLLFVLFFMSLNAHAEWRRHYIETLPSGQGAPYYKKRGDVISVCHQAVRVAAGLLGCESWITVDEYAKTHLGITQRWYVIPHDKWDKSTTTKFDRIVIIYEPKSE